jgi:hypothetical protein
MATITELSEQFWFHYLCCVETFHCWYEKPTQHQGPPFDILIKAAQVSESRATWNAAAAHFRNVMKQLPANTMVTIPAGWKKRVSDACTHGDIRVYNYLPITRLDVKFAVMVS